MGLCCELGHMLGRVENVKRLALSVGFDPQPVPGVPFPRLLSHVRFQDLCHLGNRAMNVVIGFGVTPHAFREAYLTLTMPYPFVRQDGHGRTRDAGQPSPATGHSHFPVEKR